MRWPVFLLPLFLFTASNVVSAELFRVSFDNGLNAETTAGDAKVVESSGLQFVPGVSGQAVRIPADGVLRYATEGNIQPAAGTIAFWLRLDWDPCGGHIYRDRDFSAEGIWGQVWTSPFNRSLVCIQEKQGSQKAGLRSSVNTSVSLSIGRPGQSWNINRQFFAGDWHHIAFAWEHGVAQYIYVDGCRVGRDERVGEMEFGDGFSLGTAKTGSKPLSGLDGAIDEFRIYDSALAPEQILALAAEARPVEVDLLDYAVFANQESPLRFRFRNRSAKPVTCDYALAGESQRFELAADELRIVPFRFIPDRTGVHKLVLNAGKPDMRTFEIYAIAREKTESPVGDAQLNLVEEIDCTADAGPEKLVDDGKCQVVKDYREGGSYASGAGFAYRLAKIQNLGQPHWLEIEYPDDARRAFLLGLYPATFNRLFTNTLDSMGIFTGGDYPITGKMQTKRLLFWPDTEDYVLICANYKPFALHRGAALSKIRVYENVGPLPRLEPVEFNRPLGVWQEDPIMTSAYWFSQSATCRDCDLEFWHTKLGRLVSYMHYMGHNSWVFQVAGYWGDVTGLKNTLPQSSELGQDGRVPGWVDLGAKLLEREGFDFWVRMNPLVLSPRSSQYMLDMIGDDPDARLVDKDGVPVGGRGALNPLHPKVRAAYCRLISEYAEKFGTYPNFRGLCFNEAMDNSFQDLDHGYDATTVSLFEKETGISIPAKTASERSTWLLANTRDRWIQWRMAKIAEVAEEYRRALCSRGRDDLRLQIWIKAARYLEDVGDWRTYDPRVRLAEAGIDIGRLSRLPGVIVMPAIRPDFSQCRNQNTNVPYILGSKALADTLNESAFPTLNVFRHSNLEKYAGMGPITIEKFWWPAGYNLPDNRFTCYPTPHPDTEFALLSMTQALALSDPQMLFHGWWGCPENGEFDAFRKFYDAYRRIPAGRFDLAPGTNDPVTVRVGDKGFYLVNQLAEAVDVAFLLNGEPFSRHLAGSEVYVHAMSARPDVCEVRSTVPDDVTQDIAKRIAHLEKIAELMHRMGQDSGQLAATALDARTAFAEGRFAQARLLFRTVEARTAFQQSQRDINARFDWTHRQLVLSLTNMGFEPVKGLFEVSEVPEGFEMPERAVDFPEAKTGETVSVSLPWQAERVDEWASYPFSFAAVFGNEKIEKSMWFRPSVAVSKDSDKLVWYTLRSRWHLTDPNVKGRLKEEQTGRVAWRWSPEGLTFYAEVNDPDFVPPTERGAMWKADSIQVYFDQKNDAPRAPAEYDANDAVFQVGLLNGKPEVWQETPAVGVVDIPATIVRNGDVTSYEVFFPKSVLPLANLREDRDIGWAVLLNSVRKDTTGTFRANMAFHGEPWKHPDRFRDLHFGLVRPETPK